VPYAIRIAPAAERDIRKLNKQVQKRILDRIEALGAAPRARGVEKLKGTAAGVFYRARVGDYRIIYEIQDALLIVLVLKVGNRREVYRS
jgi:mRNA interferase RelE/StbE